MTAPLRRIALVGRPNVGKSALFNRLVGRQVSIVHDQPGVTRDWIVARSDFGAEPFEVIDTGGIGAEPDPDFAAQTKAAAHRAIEECDGMVFVVDGRDGLTPLDSELAATLRTSRKPVFLAVNKLDESMHESLAMEFHRLGLGEIYPVSAAHGRGIGDLVAAIFHQVPAAEGDGTEESDTPEKREPMVAIVGRPNVGKSSLVNAILGEERTIVSEIAGTTRDAVDVRYIRDGQGYILCDTAGIRHKSKHRTSVEVFSVMRSEKTIRRADVCVLVIDATSGVTSQDKKIGGLIQERSKAAIIVVNKWDLLKDTDDEKTVRKKLIDSVRSELFFLDYAPLITLSAKSGESVPRLFAEMERVRGSARRTIGTGVLNRLLKEAMERQPPPMRKNKRFKMLYATHAESGDRRPFSQAEFILFVNDPELLDDSYRSYLERAIRAVQPYHGVPVRLTLRGREKEPD